MAGNDIARLDVLLLLEQLCRDLNTAHDEILVQQGCSREDCAKFGSGAVWCPQRYGLVFAFLLCWAVCVPAEGIVPTRIAITSGWSETTPVGKSATLAGQIGLQGFRTSSGCGGSSLVNARLRDCAAATVFAGASELKKTCIPIKVTGRHSARNKGIDRNEFVLSFLEYAGFAYVILIGLYVWEFTIGIKESIKDIFKCNN